MEPTLATSTGVQDSLTIETHDDTHHIDRMVQADRTVIESIKKTFEKVVEKITG